MEEIQRDAVVIPTAGLGTRMGKYTKHLNKALVPFNEKPILSHIIDRFPKNSKFVIITGYLSQQVKDFCSLVYEDLDITFVDVDWKSDEAGTGYSLWQCREYLKEPFWYITCDTFFNENIFKNRVNEDTYYVKHVPRDKTPLYTMYKLNKHNRIQNISFKKSTPADWVAWVGMMYIKDCNRFFDNLNKLADKNDFVQATRKNSKCVFLETWEDLGNIEMYESAVAKTIKYDFSKENEITYILEDKVVKWFKDKHIVLVKKKKYDTKQKVFPKNCKIKNHFLMHDFVKGDTLYIKHTPKILKRLLSWADNDVWDISHNDISHLVLKFYKEKTLERIKQFLSKYPHMEHVKQVNGINVKHYKEHLNWGFLIEDLAPSFIHGDFQFDNIIMNEQGEFILIDWRPDFGGSVRQGDLYYDLAKLLAGFYIDFFRIKQNKFKVKIENDIAHIEVPHIDNIAEYVDIIKQFANEKKLDFYKIRYIVPLIYLNMCALHKEPFNFLLWVYGLKLFEEI